MANRFEHSRAVLQLINRLFLATLFLLLSSTLHAAGTLSGTVMDAADGTTPVYPVWIWLWDADTNTPVEGSGVNNNPDGSYLMENIPPGAYKVFYDAYSTASGYTDKLYDNVSCNPCYFHESGDVLNVTDGLYPSDVQMVRLTMLSGYVTTDSGEPLAGVRVELLDDTGNWIRDANLTTVAGDWYINVPGPGNYFVRIATETTPGYLSEVWDNIPCNDCDVVVVGTQIVVADQDIEGIDFQLSHDPEDIIFVSNFEWIGPMLELVGPCCDPYAISPSLPVLIRVQALYTGTDSLIFTLDSGPPTMTIDEGSGALSWSPTDSDAGMEFDVALSVTDGNLSDSKSFTVRVVEGTAMTTSVESSITTVTEAGSLSGLSFDVPPSSVDPKTEDPLPAGGIGFYALLETDAPLIPTNVTRLTDFFITDGISAPEPIIIDFPVLSLPAGRHVTELQLYVWSMTALESGTPAWIPTNTGLSIIGDTLRIETYSSGQIMFIGLPPEAPAAAASAMQVKTKRQSVEAASDITCESETLYPFGYGSSSIYAPKWTACRREPDRLIQIENLSEFNIWLDGVTVVQLADWLVSARTTAESLNMVVDNDIWVKIIELDQVPSGGCAAGFTTSENDHRILHILSRCGDSMTYAKDMQDTAAHEYFHVVQHKTGKTLAASDPTLRSIMSPTNVLTKWWGWMREGMAVWFEDEVFDTKDFYAGAGKSVPDLLQTRIKWLDDAYVAFPIFKYLHTNCENFSARKLSALPSPTVLFAGDPPFERIGSLLPNWGCNFKDFHNFPLPASLESMLIAYDLSAHAFVNKDIFGEISDIEFLTPSFIPGPNLPVTEEGKPIDQVFPFEDWSEIGIVPPTTVKEVKVDGIDGILRQDQVLYLGIDNSQADNTTLTVHIASDSGIPRFDSLDRVVAGGETTFIPYDFSGGAVLALKVSLTGGLGSASDVRVGWKLVETPPTVQQPFNCLGCVIPWIDPCDSEKDKFALVCQLPFTYQGITYTSLSSTTTVLDTCGLSNDDDVGIQVFEVDTGQEC